MMITIDSGAVLRHYEALFMPLKAFLSHLWGGKMWWLRCCWLVALIPLLMPLAASASVSGTYVAADGAGAALLQIVQTPDGKLTGRFEMTKLGSSGQLGTELAAASGVSDGKTVVLTLQFNATVSLLFSGTVQGNVLLLHGTFNNAPQSLMMAISDEPSYQREVAALALKSKERTTKVHVEKLRSELLAQGPALSERAATISKEIDTANASFGVINERYKAVTARMLDAHGRQVAITGNGQASLARGQFSLAINQAAVEASDFHSVTEVEYRALDAKATDTISALASLNNNCKTGGVIGEGMPQLYAICTGVGEKGNRLSQAVKRLQSAFNSSQQIWSEERQKQEGIARAANQAVR